MALVNRLVMTWASRSESPVISSGLSSEMILTRRSSARGCTSSAPSAMVLARSKFSRFKHLLTGVETGEFQQRFDQLAHALRGALAGFHGLLVAGGVALAGQGHLGLREDDGHGRAQFVRRVGGELFLLRKRRFQPRKGGIQYRRQLAEFAFGLRHVDALRQVAGGNLGRGGADFGNGPQGAADEPPAAGEANEQNHAAETGQIQRGPHSNLALPARSNSRPGSFRREGMVSATSRQSASVRPLDGQWFRQAH